MYVAQTSNLYVPFLSCSIITIIKGQVGITVYFVDGICGVVLKLPSRILFTVTNLEKQLTLTCLLPRVPSPKVTHFAKNYSLGKMEEETALQ